MHNIKHSVKGDILTIEVNLKERHGLSGTGNTVSIASTQGAMKLGLGDIAVNLSVYTKEGLAKLQMERAKEAGYKTWIEYQKALKTPAATE